MDKPGTLRHAAVIEYSDAPIAWFYRKLGFSTCVATEEPEHEYIKELSGGAWSQVSINKFANGRGSIMEIISLPYPRRHSTMAWNHVAISVEDCHSLVRELVKEGATVTGGPIRSPSGPYVVAYVRDPSGNLVELVQRVSETDAATRTPE